MRKTTRTLGIDTDDGQLYRRQPIAPRTIPRQISRAPNVSLGQQLKQSRADGLPIPMKRR